ncbi:cell division protein FtsX [Humitalea sp. 24SJ18S-53]|uniref:cell division protein FtsX n=1 Tax=Humitalea sp. 24SJ18S-53 TaxID=3422307 RepID=UPI003D67B0A9
MMVRSRRHARDPLGLARALPFGLLPALVGAMALLAALAMAGAEAARHFAEGWRSAAADSATVLLPHGARAESAVQRLLAVPGVIAATPADPAELAALLRPWLGEGGGPALPPIVDLTLDAARAEDLAAAVAAAVPGAVLEPHGPWAGQVAALAQGVRLLALAVLALVAVVAGAVVAVGAGAGLTARRDAIVLLHEWGAADGEIAGRFARRLGFLAGGGAAVGVTLALPALMLLASLAPGREVGWAALGGLVPWLGLLAVPVAAWVLGWAVAQLVLRRWLRRLP